MLAVCALALQSVLAGLEVVHLLLLSVTVAVGFCRVELDEALRMWQKTTLITESFQFIHQRNPPLRSLCWASLSPLLVLISVDVYE